MYKYDNYLALSKMAPQELRAEIQRARDAIEHLQGFADRPVNGAYPKLGPVIEKIGRCESYIIEIERRLGEYPAKVGAMLARFRMRKVQAVGVNAAPVAAARPPAKMSACGKRCARPSAMTANHAESARGS